MIRIVASRSSCDFTVAGKPFGLEAEPIWDMSTEKVEFALLTVAVKVVDDPNTQAARLLGLVLRAAVERTRAQPQLLSLLA